MNIGIISGTYSGIRLYRWYWPDTDIMVPGPILILVPVHLYFEILPSRERSQNLSLMIYHGAVFVTMTPRYGATDVTGISTVIGASSKCRRGTVGLVNETHSDSRCHMCDNLR